MTKLSQLAESLIGSEIVRLGNEISSRIKNGEKIYNYTIGDFDPQIFPIPKELEDAVVQKYRDKFTNYPPGDGVLELRKAVASFMKHSLDLDYELNEIQIASGGRPLMYSLFRTIVNEGDKVIYSVPSWNNNHYVNMNRGEHCVIEVMPDKYFMPTAEEIRPHVKGAAMICLCSPLNPTGTTIGKEELEKICDLIIEENNSRAADEKKLYLMYDQIYFTLTFGEVKHYNPVSLRPEMKAYTIFIDGISKSFSATGVRVGWALGPKEVIAKMKALLSHIGAWAPMAEQVATAGFLQNQSTIDAYLSNFKSELEERLWKIYHGFIALKEKGFPVEAIQPQAAIYLTIKIDLVGKGILSTQSEVTDYILSEAKLAIVPFYAFGASDSSPWYRLSVGTCKKEEISDMLSKLETALHQIN